LISLKENIERETREGLDRPLRREQPLPRRDGTEGRTRAHEKVRHN